MVRMFPSIEDNAKTLVFFFISVVDSDIIHIIICNNIMQVTNSLNLYPGHVPTYFKTVAIFKWLLNSVFIIKF